MDIVKLKIPAPSVETKRKLVQDASKYFLSKGSTERLFSLHFLQTCRIRVPYLPSPPV